MTELTSFTSTYRPPTRKELEREIASDMVEYTRRPVWNRNGVLKTAIRNATALKFLIDNDK